MILCCYLPNFSNGLGATTQNLRGFHNENISPAQQTLKQTSADPIKLTEISTKIKRTKQLRLVDGRLQVVGLLENPGQRSRSRPKRRPTISSTSQFWSEVLSFLMR